MSIGENIKRIRIEKNITQKELGEKLGGISQQQIGRWETGKSTPKFETIQKITNVLGVYLGDIYEDANLPNSKTSNDYFLKVKQENISREEKQKKILNYATDILYKELKFENENISFIDQNTLFYSELIKRDLVKLNESGQKKVVDYTKDLTKIPEYQKEPDKPILNAAHADNYADAPEEMKQQEENIMDDENF